MALRYFSNAPATTLSAGCTAVDTTITVTATTGFPSSFPYTLILDRGQATEEVVDVTAGVGTSLTITRGADSTTAFAHSLGATVEHGISARDIREPNAHVNASTGVHGVSGALVGTTDTQTLTDKTIDLTDNTVTGTTAEFNAANSDGDFATLAGAETLTNKTLSSPTITGVGEVAFARKTANSSHGVGAVTTTYATDAHLQLGSLDAGTWEIVLVLKATVGPAGFKLRIGAPAGTTWLMTTHESGTSTADANGDVVLYDYTPSGADTHTAAYHGVAVIGTSGVVEVAWAEQTTSGGGATVYAGSTLTARRLA